VEIYIGLLDSPGQKSAVIGAFSDETKARGACQEHHDQDNDAAGMAPIPLVWEDDTASLPDGDSYVVVLVDLDTPNG
jgi:hypothetical protein